VSSNRPATVLVVDDSAFMRRVIGEIIDRSGEFRVVGTARNGHDALRQIHALAPDIVTLDVEMPELDGVETLGYIMSETPRAVVMLSAASTQGGVDLTLRCLELGAVDFVRKPTGVGSHDLSTVAATLLGALRAATEVNLGGVQLLARPRFVTPSPVVRSPGVFPTPDIPIIVLSAHGERKKVLEAMEIGVNEFLCKPVSAKMLTDRLISILAKPRMSVQLGDYYGPEPRKLVLDEEPTPAA
jgi:CheY-like chemotaxis protein